MILGHLSFITDLAIHRAEVDDRLRAENMSELEPISPHDAVQWYLEDRENELSYASKRNLEQGLGNFLEWTDEVGLDNLNNLTGRKARRFKTWRQDTDGLKTISLNGNLAVVRRFAVFCVDIEAVEKGIPNKIPSSFVSEDEEVRKNPPSDKEVSAVRSYLATYHPASRVHAEHETITELGIRTGAVRGIDVGDFKPAKKTIELRHRPEETGVRGTPLKNGSGGERDINISDRLRDLLMAYYNNPNRPEGTDKFGRRPLFTSKDSDGTVGRIAIGRIREDFYRISRPCELGNDCPVDRNPDECEAAKNRYAYKCPEIYTPHPLRSWSIMHQLDQGVRRDTLSNRVDVSVPVLKKHYDHRELERKQETRLDKLEGKLPGYGKNDESEDREFNLSPSITHPVFGLMVAGTEFSKLTRDRLQRELYSMAPDATESVAPNAQKAAKGAAAYALFVGLVALNLMLLGTPTSLVG